MCLSTGRKLLQAFAIGLGLSLLAACPTAEPLRTCATNDDCLESAGPEYVCDTDGDPAICRESCTTDADCHLNAQTCDLNGTPPVCVITPTS